MLSLALALSTCVASPGDPSPTALVLKVSRAEALPGSPSDPIRALYERGVPFSVFFEGVEDRRELWDRHWADSRLEEGYRIRAEAIPGRWHLLVVTVPSCSDTIGSLPYLAHLADAMPGLELRVVDAEAGRFVLQRHRAPDGREATPTVLLLDEDYGLAGCWVEQPPELQAWWPENDRPEAPLEERLRIKMAWYAEDAGRSTLEMTLGMLEAAVRGERVCPGSEGGPDK
jgi:hypothetical protein